MFEILVPYCKQTTLYSTFGSDIFFVLFRLPPRSVRRWEVNYCLMRTNFKVEVCCLTMTQGIMWSVNFSGQEVKGGAGPGTAGSGPAPPFTSCIFKAQVRRLSRASLGSQWERGVLWAGYRLTGGCGTGPREEEPKAEHGPGACGGACGEPLCSLLHVCSLTDVWLWVMARGHDCLASAAVMATPVISCFRLHSSSSSRLPHPFGSRGG